MMLAVSSVWDCITIDSARCLPAAVRPLARAGANVDCGAKASALPMHRAYAPAAYTSTRMVPRSLRRVMGPIDGPPVYI